MNEFERILYQGKDGTPIKATYRNGRTETFNSVNSFSRYIGLSRTSVQKHLNGRPIRCVKRKMDLLDIKKIERMQ